MVNEQPIGLVTVARDYGFDNSLMLCRCEGQRIRPLELEGTIGRDPVVERAGQAPR